MSVQSTITTKLDELHREHSRRWREMATAVASGKSTPNVLDLIETASALAIANPGDAIEHDAGVLKELKQAKANVELCQRTNAERLKPWGDMAELRSAAEAAKREAESLAILLAELDAGGSEVYWQNVIRQLKRTNPRLFAVEVSR
jgi:hypothetical protein